MPAQAIADPQRRLQIDPAAGVSSPRLVRASVSGPASKLRPAGLVDDGQAAAVDGDAVAQRRVAAIVAASITSRLPGGAIANLANASPDFEPVR